MFKPALIDLLVNDISIHLKSSYKCKSNIHSQIVF